MKKPIMVMSPNWGGDSIIDAQDRLFTINKVIIQRHIFPFLDTCDLLALYHCCHYLRSFVATWGGWRRLYQRDFGGDLIKSQGETPFEQYLLRSRAQLYMLWLVPNEQPQIVGPTPQFAIKQIVASSQFAAILSTTGEMYAIEPTKTAIQQMGPRSSRSSGQEESKLGLTRMRHADTRFSPKFHRIWGSHSYIHSISDRNELYMWFSSEMHGWRLNFGKEKLDNLKKVVSCTSNNWHAALVGSRVLWWTCDYTGYNHDYQPFEIKTWEYYGQDIRDIEIIGSKLLLLLDSQVQSLGLGHDGDTKPSEASYTTFEAPANCFSMGACLSILTLFCQDGATVALDVNYPDKFLLQDMSNCVDILFRPNSTWKLCADGSVHHWSSYNWANGLIWSPSQVTPLKIHSPNTLVLDKTFQWSSSARKTRQPIILDPNAVENMSLVDRTKKSIFMNRVLQIAHQYTQHSLSLHLVLMEPNPGDIFSNSTLHGSAPTASSRRRRRNTAYIESGPKKSWRSRFCL